MTDSIKQNKKPGQPFILGVAGGSGSGKTFFAQDVLSQLGHEKCEIVYQDNFYIDQSSKFDFDGGAVNFDHPSSIDFPQLAACLRQLKLGQVTQIPTYDFQTHKRKTQTLEIQPKPLIIVDGILIFHWPEVRELLDLSLFFQTSEEVRFQRRLERDTRVRGRSAEGVRNQFYKQVKPMHDQFVEPSKVYADKIICEAEHYSEALRAFCANF